MRMEFKQGKTKVHSSRSWFMESDEAVNDRAAILSPFCLKQILFIYRKLWILQRYSYNLAIFCKIQSGFQSFDVLTLLECPSVDFILTFIVFLWCVYVITICSYLKLYYLIVLFVHM